MKLSDTPLISEVQIADTVDRLAATINGHYDSRDVMVLPVLKGGLHFASDLIRRLMVPLEVDFICARSYHGTRSMGTVEFRMFPAKSLKGRDILIVEDILDTGRTTSAILDRIQAEAPASVRLCVLLDKPARRVVGIEADYVGQVIEDVFVVGYGLDHEERYRELPAIYTLQE